MGGIYFCGGNLFVVVGPAARCSHLPAGRPASPQDTVAGSGSYCHLADKRCNISTKQGTEYAAYTARILFEIWPSLLLTRGINIDIAVDMDGVAGRLDM